MRRVEFAPAADVDLAEIDNYSTLEWGAERAARYVEAIFAAIARLAADPRSGSRSRRLPGRYRTCNVGSHVVVYRDDPVTNVLEVVNILHQRMDVVARLRR